jgi:D-glycero-alpha-D-manno-heptose-7-phosphate kinase
MILSKTPLRMSFVGGGSDLPAFYRRFGGAVLSSSIDKYVYIGVNQKFDGGVRVSYSRTEEVASTAEVEHPLVREALSSLGLPGGVEITSIADVPSRGTGLGSSSSFTVGLLHALHLYCGRAITPAELGRLASEIEIVRCGQLIGKQDQYAAAYGGLNVIDFHEDDSVTVTPVRCQARTYEAMRRNILTFYTGNDRTAAGLLAAQSAATESDKRVQDALRQMVVLVGTLRDAIEAGDLSAFGEILHENWMLKRSLTSSVSGSDIDGWYDAARAAGAVGGKLLGAGQGGFLMFYAPEDRHDAIVRALGGLRQFPLRLQPDGSALVFRTDDYASHD